MLALSEHLRNPIIALLCLFTLCLSSSGHEIPERVHLITFIKVETSALSVLLRVPLESMRDLDLTTDEKGYLDVEATRPQLWDAANLWIRDYLTLYEDHRALDPGQLQRLQISLPRDRSFTNYPTALDHLVSKPGLERPTQNQAWLDLWFKYPIHSTDSVISLEPRLAHLGLRTTTLLHYLPFEGGDFLFQYEGNPGTFDLNPSRLSTLSGFILYGIEHILSGWDHLLFIFCLILPIRRLLPLIPVVTAFTLAHSVTLIASVLVLVPQSIWFPALIETLIAASILIMAFQNILTSSLRGRWQLAFAFGLIHGFGFSYALRDSLQLAGGHLLTALLSFNLGVELGQILVLVVSLVVLNLVFRYYSRQRLVILVASAIIAHSAWHWMAERFEVLEQFHLKRPDMNQQLLENSLSWALLLTVIFALVWLTSGWLNRWQWSSNEKPANYSETKSNTEISSEIKGEKT